MINIGLVKKRCFLLERVKTRLALIGLSETSARLSAFGAKRTCVGMWFLPAPAMHARAALDLL